MGTLGITNAAAGTFPFRGELDGDWNAAASRTAGPRHRQALMQAVAPQQDIAQLSAAIVPLATQAQLDSTTSTLDQCRRSSRGCKAQLASITVRGSKRPRHRRCLRAGRARLRGGALPQRARRDSDSAVWVLQLPNGHPRANLPAAFNRSTIGPVDQVLASHGLPNGVAAGSADARLT